MKHKILGIIFLVVIAAAAVGGIYIWQNSRPKTSQIPGTTKDQGILKGHAIIGPVCPVERIDNPCQPTAEMYTSRQVTVYKSDGQTIAGQKNLDSQGNYSFDLNPGNYLITIAPAGMEKDSPHNITVTASQTTTFDFNIDTGIR